MAFTDQRRPRWERQPAALALLASAALAAGGTPWQSRLPPGAWGMARTPEAPALPEKPNQRYLVNGQKVDYAAYCEWAKQWPLHHAAEGGKGAAQRLEALLGTEGSLSEADRQAGRTALTDAQRRVLLDQKETHTGRTALHYAVSIADMSKEGSTRPTQALLENGADVFALDNDGRTPLDLALSFRDWEYDTKRLQVVSMLRSEVDSAWGKGRRPNPWSARHPWDNGYKEHHPLHEACCRDDLIATQRILGPVLHDIDGSPSVHRPPL